MDAYFLGIYILSTFIILFEHFILRMKHHISAQLCPNLYPYTIK